MLAVTARACAFLLFLALWGQELKEPRPPARIERTGEELQSLSVLALLERMPPRWLTRVDGDWVFEPTHAELQRRVEKGLLSDEEWRAAIAAGDVIHTRSRWQAGKQLLVWIRQPAWLRSTKITLRVLEPDLGEVAADNLLGVTCGNCALMDLNRQRSLRLRRLPLGVEQLVCNLTIEQANNPGTVFYVRGTHRLWEGRLVIPLESVRDVDAVLPSSNRPEEEDAVRSSLCALWVEATNEDPARLRLRVGGALAARPALDGLGLDLEVEVWCGSTRVGSCSLLSGNGRRFLDESVESVSYSSLLEIPQALAPIRPQDAAWSLVIAGRRNGLVSLWEADRWWAGRITMPLAAAIQNCGTR